MTNATNSTLESAPTTKLTEPVVVSAAFFLVVVVGLEAELDPEFEPVDGTLIVLVSTVEVDSTLTVAAPFSTVK